MKEACLNVKILLVDNIPGQLRALENLLKGMGFTSILTARDVKEAMTHLVAHSDIGLILAEWDLPQTSGLAFHQLVKANAKLAAIPFLLIFKQKTRTEIVNASMAGVLGFLVKPYNGEVIKKKIASLFAESNEPKSEEEKESACLKDILKDIPTED